MRGQAVSGGGCALSASGLARVGRGNGRRAAGRASPRPSRRCRGWWQRDSRTVPWPGGSTSRRTPSTPTSGTCSPSWACRIGSRSPPWYITRSSDVFAARSSQILDVGSNARCNHVQRRCHGGPRCDDAEYLRADQRGRHRQVRRPGRGRLRRAPGWGGLSHHEGGDARLLPGAAGRRFPTFG